MDDFTNPSKKPRLDEFDLQDDDKLWGQIDQDCDDPENELWGQIDFTVEEIEMLESQATQQAAQQTNQATGQQANQATGQQANWTTVQQANQTTGQLANQASGQLANQASGQRANQATGQRADRTIGGLANQAIGGIANQAIGGLANQAIGGLANQAIGGLANQASSHRANHATGQRVNQTTKQAVQEAEQDKRNKVQKKICVGQEASLSMTNAELENLKLQQYAIEGKNKVLSELLAKTQKELSDERLNRDQIVNSKLSKSKQTEADLQQEIEKLNTTLLFKDQELRSERSKTLSLENKLKEKANVQSHANSTSREASRKHSPAKKSSSKLHTWCTFDFRNNPCTKDSAVQTEIDRCRKYPLSLQSPRGEPRETDVVSKLLSCRVVDLCCRSNPVFDCEANMESINEIFRRARDHSSLSATTLRCNKESDALWRPYEVALQEYIDNLRIKWSSLKLASERVCIFSEGMCHTNLNCQQHGILSCLKDLARLLFHRCPKEPFRNSRELNGVKFAKRSYLEVSISSLPLFPSVEEKMDVTMNRTYCLLELLVMLASPSTYPNDYEKTCVIEWALAALVAWSSHSKESLELCIQELPLHSLVSGSHGMECAYLSLKLMTSLIGLTSFKGALEHCVGSRCILCSVGEFCECMYDKHSSNAARLFLSEIANFLFGVLNCYGFAVIGKESTPCSSQLLQGIITVLLRQVTSSQDCNLPDYISVMRKGVMLLSFMFTYLPDFKSRRALAEEKYISLICNLVRLCRKNPNYKKFRSKVKDLWDFSGDISAEFDSEETQSTQDL